MGLVQLQPSNLKQKMISITLRLNGIHETVYFFEKFVTSSEICTFDGLIDHDGNIVFSTTFDYAHTPLDLMIYKMDNSYYVLKKWIQSYVSMVRQLSKNLV